MGSLACSRKAGTAACGTIIQDQEGRRGLDLASEHAQERSCGVTDSREQLVYFLLSPEDGRIACDVVT